MSRVEERGVLSAEEAERLRNLYDVGEWRSWSRAPLGHANVSFVIAAETGKYVLRRSNPRKSSEGLHFEAALVDFLRGKGYPAPELIPSRQGERYVGHSGVFYLLTRFIPGRPYDPENPGHLPEAARNLGLYHGLVRNFSGPFPPQPSHLMTYLDQGVEGSLTSRFSGSETRKRLAAVLSSVRGRQERILSRLRDIYPPLPKLLIHASYGQSALIFDGDALAGVVDYDRARYELRALDIAYSVKELCRAPGAFRRRRPVALDLDRLGIFLRAYRQVEALPEEELRVLPVVFRARHIMKIIEKLTGFLLKDAVKPREEKHAQNLVLKLEREVAWLEWLEQHEGELASALSGG